jgi:hypothetical protein
MSIPAYKKPIFCLRHPRTTLDMALTAFDQWGPNPLEPNPNQDREWLAAVLLTGSPLVSPLLWDHKSLPPMNWAT